MVHVLSLFGFRQREREFAEGSGGHVADPLSLSLHKFAEHFLWVDSDENPFAAGQYLAFCVQDFRHVDVLAPMHGHFPALDA
jgi:hypothetical protein